MMMDRRAIPDGMAFGTWRARDGWTLRRFDWSAAAARGNLLFLGGRGDFIEKYLEALAHWHGGGWSLAGFDWRGQGGSGRYLEDRSICHVPDFDALLGDLVAFAGEWKAKTRGPHIVIAHSMGAQLALRLLAAAAPQVDGAVLLSPMVGLRPLPAPIARAAATAAALCGRGERRIWRRDLGNYGGRMTSCPERQDDKLWWKAVRPDIASGSPSWGWLRAACASIASLPERELGSIAVPLLILASSRDPVIDIAAVRRVAARLTNADLRLWEGKGHELLRESDAVRLPVLDAIDVFLERTASGDRRPAHLNSSCNNPPR